MSQWYQVADDRRLPVLLIIEAYVDLEGMDVQEWIITTLGALGIVAILYIFYIAIQTRWPENYVSSSGDVGLVISRSVGRYLLFMFAPVYFVTLIVSTTVARFDGSAFYCAIASAVIHLSRTQLLHFLQVTRHIDNHTRFPSIIVGIAASFVVLLAALLGSFGPGPFTAIVPPVDEFFKSLWTTMFVGLLAVVVFRAWETTKSPDILLDRSRREVGRKLLAFAEKEAQRLGADPVLVQGILLTENLQRPSWIRTLERWKGSIGLFSKGSYGVMQVVSDRPLTDEESITRAISEHLVGPKVKKYEPGFYDDVELKAFLRRYNDNSDFVSVAANLIDELCRLADREKIEAKEDGQSNEISRKAQLEERVKLATHIWTQMAPKIVAQENGIVAIASMPLEDLRTLAQLTAQVPKPSDPAKEAMQRSAHAALQAQDDGASGDGPKSDATPS